jgi:predicted amidophosphoribosyltransferase
VTTLPLLLTGWLLDLAFPRRCVSCGAPSAALCAGCLAALRPLRAPCCRLCGAPTTWPVERCLECAGRRIAFARARSAYAYAGPARPFVHAWKERGLRHLTSVAVDLLAERIEIPAVDVVTAVAPDRIRQLARGRHPAEGLAVGLARQFGLPHAVLLARTSGRPRQTGLRLVERRANVREVFRARGRVPARVLLVDDVYTTGTTVNAAATALRRAGAQHVEVVTFARAAR